METPNLANAGQDAVASSAPISGGNVSIEPAASPASSQPRGIDAAFEKARASLDATRPPSQDRREAPTQAEPSAASVPQPNGQTPPASAASAVPAEKPIEAPKRWPEARREFFAKQPREIQQAMLDLHNDWNKGYSKTVEEHQSHKQFAEQVRGLFDDDIRGLAKQAGLDEIGALKHSLQLVQLFNKDPVSFMAQVMQRRNIDPRIFLQGQNPQTQQEIPNAVQQLAPIVQPLYQELEALKAFKADLEKQNQVQRAKSVESTIASFVGEKDDTGSPKFPYLERVLDDMDQILRSDPRLAAMDDRQRLESAYNIAVYSNPELRNEIVTAEAKKQAAALDRSRGEDRIKAAATVKPTTAPGGAAPQAKGIQAAFQKAVRQVGQAR